MFIGTHGVWGKSFDSCRQRALLGLLGMLLFVSYFLMNDMMCLFVRVLKTQRIKSKRCHLDNTLQIGDLPLG